MDGKVTIYALCDDTGVRYIGQTRVIPERRLLQHMSQRSGQARAAWVADLRAQGLRPRLVILEVVDAEEADDAEARQIAEHRARGCALVNMQRAPRRKQLVPRRQRGRPRSTDPADFCVMLRLPRSTRRTIEREAQRTRTPVAVLVRSWVLERVAEAAAQQRRAAS